jgi:hypothetical protein
MAQQSNYLNMAVSLLLCTSLCFGSLWLIFVGPIPCTPTMALFNLRCRHETFKHVRETSFARAQIKTHSEEAWAYSFKHCRPYYRAYHNSTYCPNSYKNKTWVKLPSEYWNYSQECFSFTSLCTLERVNYGDDVDYHYDRRCLEYSDASVCRLETQFPFVKLNYSIGFSVNGTFYAHSTHVENLFTKDERPSYEKNQSKYFVFNSTNPAHHVQVTDTRKCDLVPVDGAWLMTFTEKCYPDTVSDILRAYYKLHQ